MNKILMIEEDAKWLNFYANVARSVISETVFLYASNANDADNLVRAHKDADLLILDIDSLIKYAPRDAFWLAGSMRQNGIGSQLQTMKILMISSDSGLYNKALQLGDIFLWKEVITESALSEAFKALCPPK